MAADSAACQERNASSESTTCGPRVRRRILDLNLDWVLHQRTSAAEVVAALAIFAATAYGVSWLVHGLVIAWRRRAGALEPLAARSATAKKLFTPLLSLLTLALLVFTLSAKGYLLEQVKERPCGSFLASGATTSGCCPAPVVHDDAVCSATLRLSAGLMAKP